MLTASARTSSRFAACFVALALALLICAAQGAARAFDDTRTDAGTIITNRAEASYEDEAGIGYATVSPTITLTVRPVAAVIVTPDETEASASVGAHERVTRLFRICNAGNTPDIYTITALEVSAPATLAELHFDLDNNGVVSPDDRAISVGANMTPRLAPGACASALAVIDTNGVAEQSLVTLRLTARSNTVQTVNGLAQDDGTIINIVGRNAQLTDPTDANRPPLKLVEGRSRTTAAAGQTLNYTIAFRNSGGVSARRVRVMDELPDGLEYTPGSLRLDGRTLSDADDADEGLRIGRRLEVRVGDVAVSQAVQITFQARQTGEIVGGTSITNIAHLTGDNFAALQSASAVAVFDPFGVVYAGHTGGAVRIGGARVSLLTEQTGGALALPPGVGFLPNEANDNPFRTDAQGRFAFALAGDQLGSAASAARYYISVTAPGYRGRMLEIALEPVGNDVFAATVRALDEQPIARAGSYQLTTEETRIENIASIALNIPLFELSALEIIKSADKQHAEIGDMVAYRVAVRNATASPVNEVTVRDGLPQSFHYAQETARIEGGAGGARSIEPETATDGQLVFPIGRLSAGESVTLSYRVRIGANAPEGEQFNSAVASGVYLSGERLVTPAARAGVRVGRGLFSTRQFIVGRVFEDANGNGQFDRGERALEGVRLYLNNGQSVITDSAGMYNLPAIGDGAAVISLDPITVPAGLTLSDEGRRSGRSLTRLLRTPLGGGALLRQNFALVSSGSTGPALTHGGATPGFAAQEASAGTAPTSAAHDPATNAANDNSRASNASAASPSSASAPASNGRATDGATPSDRESVNRPRGAGTYEIEATAGVAPVAAGEVLIASPAANAVVMSPALALEARVAEAWTVSLEVNGARIAETNIGERRIDRRNRVATYTFVGINLRPGPNRIKVTPISPDGVAGRTTEHVVYGRGPVRRLEIIPERREVQAGGRDRTTITVRAYDQWGHPAADTQVTLQTSAGQLRARVEQTPTSEAATGQNSAITVQVGAISQMASIAGAAQEVPALAQQQVARLAGGEAVWEFVSEGTPATAQLRAGAGDVTAQGELRIIPEVRPAILVGLAEISIGSAAPEISQRGDEGTTRSRLAFFYRGPLFGENLLTIAYDSHRPLNRTAGRDRLFQLDPLDRAYPLFGDSSTRFEDAQSNSKLYLRFDRGRSYFMFGDFDAGLANAGLASYARSLTGVAVHLENSAGDFVTVTGARPDTAFARDVIAGGSLALARLSHGEILPGSETVVLEVRDRRNPEVILLRETLARSIDYNLNPTTGEIFFLRPISAFDYELNLLQTVVTYEYRATGLAAAVYTARAQRRFGQRLRVGLALVNQRQDEFGSFLLGGVDGELTLPRRGRLDFAWAMSRGSVMTGGNVFGAGRDREHNGQAFSATLEQPLPFAQAVLRANFSRSGAGFLNPYGQTVTPGAQRAGAALDVRPRSSTLLRFHLLDERNRTENVNNRRFTTGVAWTEAWHDRLRTTVSYDHRRLTDEMGDRSVDSNLVTVGVEYRPTDRLELSVTRDQNLGEADPTYPNQTRIAASYRFMQGARLFFTQRLASAPITPIADVSGTGFAATGALRETAFGVESQLGRYTALSGRYQIENGINGTDSFAVIGLQNRLPLTSALAIDLRFERGFHLAGAGESFNSAGVGVTWLPTENFRTSARYELRDRNGFGQLLTMGAAGRLGDGITALAQMQWGRAVYGERSGATFNGTAALALRPLESDRYGLLFSYTRRSLEQEAGDGRGATRDRSDMLSADGYLQATSSLELHSRFALRLSANGDANMPYAATATYLWQGRAQQRLGRYLDFAGEARTLWQPASATRRSSYGAELGLWALPDLRLGVGYNFTQAREPAGVLQFDSRRGFYFTISSKLSRLFDLFGTAQQSARPQGQSNQPAQRQQQKPASDGEGEEPR